MIRKLILTLILTGGTATAYVSPAHAQGAAYWGPHGAAVTHSGPPGNHFYGGGPCCYRHHSAGAAAVAGLAVGAAIGIASRPAYRAPPVVAYVAPPVVYAAPPVIYTAPPVVYAPGAYYYPH